MTRRTTAEFQRNRKIVLADNPVCVWCRRAPATEVDHVTPWDAGGTDDLENLVPACKPCNSRRGAEHVNKKRALQQQRRHEAMTGVFQSRNTMPPTPIFVISPNEAEPAGSEPTELVRPGLGVAVPRLATPAIGYESYGPLIAAWGEEHLGLTLFPWQVRALTQAFAHREDGTFVHSRSITSTARQNGKTTMLACLVGWALTELPRIWGRPVRVLNVAHELALATEVWEALSDTMELWEESGVAKVTWAYGRNKVEMADKSRWVVKAATGKKHGGTYDLIIADELWALSEPAVFGALLPSQIAVPSPHFFATSTAGDESSRVMLRMREQALALIDKGEQGTLSLCEWSLPPDVNPWDETNWGWANPAMPMTINLQGLHDAAASPDKTSFLRAHCNLWVSAANAWIAPGVWARLQTDDPQPAGGVLAVDSSVDETRYVGARVGSDGENIVASVGLVAEHTAELWAEVERAMTDDPTLQLAVTPSLELMLPEKWRKRTVVWGYGELLKATPLVRNLIAEGRLRHHGEQMLAEHVNRAVLVRANGSVVVSSQKSPGPIELCRCLIAAAGYVVKPKNAGKPTLGVAR